MTHLPLKIHGILDYATVVVLVGAGLGHFFSEHVSHLMIALGLIHLALTIFSQNSMGFIKVIPMRIHGVIELIVSIALIPAPFIFGYADEPSAKIFTWVFAGVVLALYIATEYVPPMTTRTR